MTLQLCCHSPECRETVKVSSLIDAAEQGWVIVQGLAGDWLFPHCPACATQPPMSHMHNWLQDLAAVRLNFRGDGQPKV